MPKKKKSKETVFPPLWGERREDVDDPTVEEAREREFKFLHSLEVADSTFDQILINKDWLKLGFTTFAEWWRVRVMPVMHSLEVKPVSAVVDAGIRQVQEDNAELPRPQRTTQREMGEMFGVNQSTVSRSIANAFASGSDLVRRRTQQITQPENVHVLINVARDKLCMAIAEIRAVSLRFEGDALLDLLNLLTELDDTAKELRTSLTEPQPDLDEELRNLTNNEGG